jgi:serine/threonine-protein kinase
VAVKTLRAEHRTPAATARLLREAWITGSLEHPNVVPVHDVALDDQGSPVLVLKRIEGTTWSTLLRDARTVEKRFGAKDLLAFNLETLVQVCNAVHFAHSRGVVHRDLKPENVMVGEFGEVYVLDWGIALPISRDRLSVPGGERVVGTPAYLAPEMLLGDLISERTDVYLLGAILVEILTGRPPHDVASPLEIVESVLASSPKLPDDAPAELTLLARACLQRDPMARPKGADEVRRVLRDYLEHRGSIAITEEAEARLDELSADAVAGDADVTRVHALHGECVFGFRHALRTWPENRRARQGLREAVRVMIEHDLSRDDVRGAAARLADLPEPDPELTRRVRAAERRARDEEAKVDALRALARDLDPRRGRRIRLLLGMVLGGVWTLSPLGGMALTWGHPERETLFGNGAASVGQLAIAIAVVVVARARLKKTRLNRQLARIVLLALSAQVLAYAGAWAVGATPATTEVALFFAWFLLVGSVAVMLETRVWPAAAVMLATFFIGCARPDLHHALNALGNFVLTVNILVVWRETRDTLKASSRASSGLPRSRSP